jgi:hypothetical protein
MFKVLQKENKQVSWTRLTLDRYGQVYFVQNTHEPTLEYDTLRVIETCISMVNYYSHKFCIPFIDIEYQGKSQLSFLRRFPEESEAPCLEHITVKLSKQPTIRVYPH